ncbi:calmodulin-like isoform X2 [Crassostrea virginica]|uniref:Calmodulin-A-like isoform X1 n=1 Tax=Crassostrea virginica TaxID=6565 RepID=A0A8B8CYJ3_CRAVI|nr:calmodulin-A-like isoform X1 [Crassostrea virginica]
MAAHVRITTANSIKQQYNRRRASAPVKAHHVIVKAQRSRSLNDIAVPEEQKRELKEAFGMFETRKGKMSAKDLGPLLRCLGLNPSERDLEEARHELDVSAKGRITYADVERYIMSHGDVYAEETEDILEAFRVLDKYGNGKISVSDFRRCMTTMGDRMTVDEVDEIIKYAKSDGFIEYEDLLRELSESTK